MIGQCPGCKWFRDYAYGKHGESTCDAFPLGIPGDILVGTILHNRPVAGDGGKRFEYREHSLADRLNKGEKP